MDDHTQAEEEEYLRKQHLLRVERMEYLKTIITLQAKVSYVQEQVKTVDGVIAANDFLHRFGYDQDKETPEDGQSTEV